jgi:MGT family glycosyltransferase
LKSHTAPLIVASIPLTGHTRPMLALARGLVAAGRRVTFLGGSRFAEDARTVGATFVPLGGVADFDDRRLSELHPQMFSLPAGPRQLDYMYRWAGDMAPDQHAGLQQLLRAHADAVVLHDMAFLGSWPTLLGAPGVRARTIAVGMLPFMFPGAEVTLMGPPPPMEGLDVRGAAAMVNAEIEDALAPARDHVREVLSPLGAAPGIDSFSLAVYTLPDAFVQLTVSEFEYPRSDLPDSVHFVGPLAPEPSPTFRRPPWWPDMNGRKVVVVTQGTMANLDFSQLVQPTLDALADTDLLVVAALGREPRAGELRVPPNARVAPFIPFDVLFPLADAFITNGGYGGTQLALAHGLPVVVAGGTEDKPMTAARAAAFGVGVDLGTPRPEPTAVHDAVQRVLRDESFRERAAALAQRYRASDPIARILELADQT